LRLTHDPALLSCAMKSKTVITQLRFEPALLEKITEAAQRTGLSKADVMRLAMETGLEDLRRLQFDLPTLISQSARLTRTSLSYAASDDPSDTLRVAEDEG
jgi:DNA-binding MurR/RpiR family transcriptional regulator